MPERYSTVVLYVRSLIVTEHGAWSSKPKPRQGTGMGTGTGTVTGKAGARQGREGQGRAFTAGL